MRRDGKSSLVIQEEGTWRRRGVRERLSSVRRRNDDARRAGEMGALIVVKHWMSDGRAVSMCS